MSRVFQALEKAEQEKKQRGREDQPVPSFEVKPVLKKDVATEVKPVLKKEVATLKFPEP